MLSVCCTLRRFRSGMVSEPPSEVASPGEDRRQFQCIKTTRRRHQFVAVAYLPWTAPDFTHVPPSRRQAARLLRGVHVARRRRLRSSSGSRAVRCVSGTPAVGAQHSGPSQLDAGSQSVRFQT